MANNAPGFEKHPNYEVKIEPANAHVRVLAGDLVLADTESAVLVEETKHRPVYYVPLKDVSLDFFEDTETSTYCPFKGKASYKSLVKGETVEKDVLWFYPEPYDEVADLIEYASFYTDRVTLEVDGERQGAAGPGWEK